MVNAKNVFIVVGFLLITAVVSCKTPMGEINAREYDTKFRQRFIGAFPLLARDILTVSGKKDGVCVDLGCGPGYLGLAIAEQSSMKVYSLDISPRAIELAKNYVAEKKLDGRVYPAVGDVHRLPYGDSSADLVVSRGSLPFWRDRAAAFREVLRVLKPGGQAHIGCGFGAGYIRIPPNNEHGNKKPPRKFTHEEVIDALEAADISNYTVTDDSRRGYWIVIRKLRP